MSNQETTKIQLTREQQLELENIQLKISGAQREMQQLLTRRAQLMSSLSEDHDVSLQGWIVDLDQGVVYSPAQVQKAAVQ